MTSCLLKKRARGKCIPQGNDDSNDMDKPKKVKSVFLLFGALLIAATALFVFGWLAEAMLEGTLSNSMHSCELPSINLPRPASPD